MRWSPTDSCAWCPARRSRSRAWLSQRAKWRRTSEHLRAVHQAARHDDARHDGHPRLRLDGLSRSEEHTSELQSRLHLVCRLLLEKKKKKTKHMTFAISTVTKSER